MRRPIFAANWKLHKNRSEAAAYVRELLPLVADSDGSDIVLAPPFTALDAVAGALAGSAVALAAQNVHPAASGAFTGEVAPGMLSDLGCRFAIVGHSERRALFGETDAFVASKAAALLEAGLRPIVCIGETLAERDAGRTFEVLRDSSSPAASRASPAAARATSCSPTNPSGPSARAAPPPPKWPRKPTPSSASACGPNSARLALESRSSTVGRSKPRTRPR